METLHMATIHFSRQPSSQKKIDARLEVQPFTTQTAAPIWSTNPTSHRKNANYLALRKYPSDSLNPHLDKCYPSLNCFQGLGKSHAVSTGVLILFECQGRHY
jgi:hypothetical protein